MNKRECSDCRENEKTFRNNFNYKCENDYCENYIKPVELVDFQKDMINQLIDRLNEKQNENLRLKREIKRLLRKLNMCDITF
jgi:uncharacterized coiled-coil protein SlyX